MSLRQRCLIHRARNVLAKVPAGMQAEVKDAFWALFDTEDLTTKPGPRLVELVDHRITDMADRTPHRMSAPLPNVRPAILGRTDRGASPP
jgi:hypothetical protein